MAGIDFRMEVKGIAEMQAFLLAMQGKANRPAAVAMTRTAKVVQQTAVNLADRYIDGRPTRWTRNATFVKPAKPDRLEVTVGWKDYSSKGVPAAQYLQSISAGGPRLAKPFEKRLRSKGILGPTEFAIPAGIKPLGLDTHGNLPGPKYMQVLSRMQALREVGSLQNVSGSKRSRRKQQQVSYFVATVGGQRGLYLREKGSRRIVPAFYFVNQAPRYSQTFPIHKGMMQAWKENFGREWEKAIQEEMDYQARKARR